MDNTGKGLRAEESRCWWCDGTSCATISMTSSIRAKRTTHRSKNRQTLLPPVKLLGSGTKVGGLSDRCVTEDKRRMNTCSLTDSHKAGLREEQEPRMEPCFLRLMTGHTAARPHRWECPHHHFLNCSHTPSLGTSPPTQAQKEYCPRTPLYLAGLHSHLWKRHCPEPAHQEDLTGFVPRPLEGPELRKRPHKITAGISQPLTQTLPSDSTSAIKGLKTRTK